MVVRSIVNNPLRPMRWDLDPHAALRLFPRQEQFIPVGIHPLEQYSRRTLAECASHYFSGFDIDFDSIPSMDGVNVRRGMIIGVDTNSYSIEAANAGGTSTNLMGEISSKLAPVTHM